MWDKKSRSLQQLSAHDKNKFIFQSALWTRSSSCASVCCRPGRREAHRRSNTAGGHDAGEGTQSQPQRWELMEGKNSNSQWKLKIHRESSYVTAFKMIPGQIVSIGFIPFTPQSKKTWIEIMKKDLLLRLFRLSLIHCLSAPCSHRSERHEVADVGDVPALRGGLHGRPLPGRQEAQVHHQIQEQQLVGQVQRGLPVVSVKAARHPCTPTPSHMMLREL